MMDFLLKIEQSGFSQWVRGSDSLFAFAGILLLHTIGMGFVVGVNATIDLRILGFAPALRLGAMEVLSRVMCWFFSKRDYLNDPSCRRCLAQTRQYRFLRQNGIYRSGSYQPANAQDSCVS
jgi:hypothetical protein